MTIMGISFSQTKIQNAVKSKGDLWLLFVIPFG